MSLRHCYCFLYDLRFSRLLSAIKSSRATSRVKIELQSNVSEAPSASIIREWCISSILTRLSPEKILLRYCFCFDRDPWRQNMGDRKCAECLVRTLERKRPPGEPVVESQYWSKVSRSIVWGYQCGYNLWKFIIEFSLQIIEFLL
jgi:hypothetical protein